MNQPRWVFWKPHMKVQYLLNLLLSMQPCCIPPPHCHYCTNAMLGSTSGFNVSMCFVNLVVINNPSFMWIMCKYQCEYGPWNDLTNVLVMHNGLVTEKDKLDIKVKRIPNRKGHKTPRVSKKMNRLRLKKACQCGFLLGGCGCYPTYVKWFTH